VKAGAVAAILVLDPQFSIDLQLIGGVIILQTLPAIVFGLYIRFYHAWGLLAGWLAGMGAGMYMLYQTPNAMNGKAHFGGPQYALSHLGFDSKVTIYTGIVALLVNIVVATVVTLIVRAAGRPYGEDSTQPGDYIAEAGEPGVEQLPATEEEAARR
jgi:SSS family solute:Na+ symporter